MLSTQGYWSNERVAERNIRREEIASHIEAGTCHICEQVVDDGAAIHGPTGAHWECYSGPVLPSDSPQPAECQSKPDTHPRMARANGGALVHFVILTTGVSLCGHKPKDTARHMKQRGKWLIWREDATVPSHMKQCSKCVAKAAVLYPPIHGDHETESPASHFD